MLKPLQLVLLVLVEIYSILRQIDFLIFVFVFMAFATVTSFGLLSAFLVAFLLAQFMLNVCQLAVQVKGVMSEVTVLDLASESIGWLIVRLVVGSVRRSPPLMVLSERAPRRVVIGH